MAEILITIPDNVGYKEFAAAVADALHQDYGTHNYRPFIKALQNELGIDLQQEAFEASRETAPNTKMSSKYPTYEHYSKSQNENSLS